MNFSALDPCFFDHLFFVSVYLGRQMAVPEGATPAGRPPGVDQAPHVTTGWDQLDSIDMSECMLRRVPMLKSCPRFLRGRLRQCWNHALRERCRAKQEGDLVAEVRAWKLFCLVPMMILCKPRSVGSVGRDELAKRIQHFEEGRWVQLLEAASEFEQAVRRSSQCTEEEQMVRRGQAAQSRVERGQVSRARHELTGAPLALKNEETLAQLRRQRPQEQIKEIPRAVSEFQPDHPLNMDRKIFFDCLRGAPSGVASGPGGCTNEMLRVCLDDQETVSLLFEAAEDFARGQVPPVVCRSLMLATMTTLQKRDGGVRGIAAGTSFRRLVAKTLARQFSDAVEAACAPLQFALSTRAGVDCVGHAVRVATELNPI